MSSSYDICCYAAGAAGNIFAIVLFLSPIPTFRRILKVKSTEQFSGLPYVYGLLNCLVCMWYGLPFISNAILVLTVNTIGAVFQLVYVTLFIIYGDTRRKKLKMSGLLICASFAFGVIVHLTLRSPDQATRQVFVGIVSASTLVAMFASPLHVIELVIRTKCVEFMPFHLSLALFAMSAAFFVYGMLLNDYFIYLPNGLGVFLGALQLSLYAYYSMKWKEDTTSVPLLV